MPGPVGFSNEYMQLQGAFYLGDRDANGAASNWRFVGNVPNGTLRSQMESADHIESYSGKRRKDLKLFGQRTAALSITLENLEAKNLCEALLGKLTTDASATTVTNELFTVGDQNYILLKNGGITTFTSITDNQATPQVIAQANNYQVDLQYGVVRILNGTTFPKGSIFRANYTAAAKTRVTGLSESVKYKWLRFDGLNVLTGKAVMIWAPKVTILPDSEMELITGEGDVANLAVNMDILFDEKQLDESLSYYYVDYLN
jgi:hypothetical protein